MAGMSRRKMLIGGSLAALPLIHELVPHGQVHSGIAQALEPQHGGGGAHSTAAHAGSGHNGTVGRVDPAVNGFDPAEIVRDFDWGTTRRTATGTVREWEILAEDKEIEVAPGVKYAAWTYNGRVPGPTLRAREGERLRVRFVNASRHPHTMHFHGIHTASQDGIPGIGAGNIEPGRSTTYEFGAEPFGLHLYHCHSTPLADHIAKGLYGAFIIDPKQGRPEADELVMVMNGFDTNFDRTNEIYAVNTVAFDYMNEPIRVKRDELVRIYLVNILEYDLLNSFHIHANFFNRFPTGTSLEPTELTDTIIQGQGQRDILELRFPYTGKYMFHAHVSEFAELGWMGFFEVYE
ncbi:MAG: multicopper oxidase domain-containing protein [Thermoleophilaceae bacterium]|nr:multicopper oxidase domain-containing protein [Thermoleophilaceae bacterium]